MRDKQSRAACFTSFLYIKVCAFSLCLGCVEMEASENRTVQEIRVFPHGLLNEECDLSPRFDEKKGVVSSSSCKAQIAEHLLTVFFEVIFTSDTALQQIHVSCMTRDCLATELEPAAGLDRCFHSLRLTPEDCHNISVLIKNMADLSLWALLKKSHEMRQLGKKIEPVHPLRFLGWIFSNGELKKRMPKIQQSYFKWKKFTEGLFDRLAREAQMGNINPFISDFAQLVGCSQIAIEQKVINGDWAGMLTELMH